jgi:hypothetical protein
MGGIDLDNGPTYPLLTVEQAELGPTYPVTGACVSQPSGAAYGAVAGACPNGAPCCQLPGATCGTTADPCLTNTTPESCAAANKASSKTFCGWNVIPYAVNGAPANLSSSSAPATCSDSTICPYAAPTRLCQAQNLGQGGNGADVGGSLVAGFGNASEFYMEWAVPTHRAYYMQLTTGYVGQMAWTYKAPDGWHAYRAAIGQPMLKDNKPFNMVWAQTKSANASGDEIYRGVASTFAPDIYDNAPAGVLLTDTGTGFVIANVGGGQGEIGMRPVSFYIVFYPNTLGAVEGVTVYEFYAFNIKYAPYSGAVSYFKMVPDVDAGLATAQPNAFAYLGNGGEGGAPVTCKFGMGDTFANLLNNCIHVFNAGANAGTVNDPNIIAANKVLGDSSHDDQNYTFQVVGIGQNFRPVKLDVCTPQLAAYKKAGKTCGGLTPSGSSTVCSCGTDIEDVIHDSDSLPADPANALANNFNSDVRSFGAIQNDSYPPGHPTTGPGTCTAGDAGACAAASKASVCDTSSDPNDPNVGRCVTAAWNHDYHGGGAIWREYGRLVQNNLNAEYVALHGAQYAKLWHDQTCMQPMSCTDQTAATPVYVPGGQSPSTCTSNAPLFAPKTKCATCTGGATGTCTLDGDGGDLCAGLTGAGAAPPMCDTDPTTGANAGFCVDTTAFGPDSKMPMMPQTTCAVDADCKQPGATCYTGATYPAAPASPLFVHNTCVVPMDPSTWRPAQGCTGFETFVTNAEPLADPDPSSPQQQAGDDMWDFGGGLGSLGGTMKPGDPNAYFCNDIGSYNLCEVTVPAGTTDLLSVSAAQVLAFLGRGNILNVPEDGRDKRYFFQQFSYAYAKYLTSPNVLNQGGHSAHSYYQGVLFNGLPVGDFGGTQIDTDNFIFDSFGGGGARSEYVDFDSADLNNDPVDVEQRILLLNSNLQATDFFRKLDREERALFNSLATDQTQAAWGYLRDSSGNFINDTFPAGNAQNPAGVPCTTTADCQKPAPAGFGPLTTAICDLTPAAQDANSGLCVYSFHRHNANPFITNLAGSGVVNTFPEIAALGAVPYSAPTDPTTGNLIPAPAGWVDPCNPVPNPAPACKADTDCPGTLSCNTTTSVCQPAKTAYFCATHFDSDCQNGGSNNPPTNNDGTLVTRQNGKPQFEGYCAVLDAVPLGASGLGPFTLGSSPPVTIQKTFLDEGEAFVSMPVYSNPYGGTPTSFTNVMVPWLPYQEGVGFPVANSTTGGSQDVFVQTAQLDFAGQVMTTTLDFLPSPLSCLKQSDCGGGQTCVGAVPAVGDSGATNVYGQCIVPGQPATNPAPPYGVNILAWETQDFLGEIFLCSDSGAVAQARLGTARPPDLLSVHMYTPVSTIIDWLAAHPQNEGPSSQCQIVIRYSPFNNYPDYITSLGNGVRLDVDQGYGFGRIVDATLFVPGSGAPVQP